MKKFLILICFIILVCPVVQALEWYETPMPACATRPDDHPCHKIKIDSKPGAYLDTPHKTYTMYNHNTHQTYYIRDFGTHTNISGTNGTHYSIDKIK